MFGAQNIYINRKDISEHMQVVLNPHNSIAQELFEKNQISVYLNNDLGHSGMVGGGQSFTLYPEVEQCIVHVIKSGSDYRMSTPPVTFRIFITDEEQPKPSNPVQSSNMVAHNSQPVSQKPVMSDSILNLTEKQLVEIWGQPLTKTLDDDLLKYQYEGFSVNFDNNTKEILSVVMEGISEYCGIHKSMTPTEIKEILGQPNFEGMNEAGGWSYNFYLPNGELWLETDRENRVVTGAYLYPK